MLLFVWSDVWDSNPLSIDSSLCNFRYSLDYIIILSITY